MGAGWRAAKELKRGDLVGKTGTTNEAKDAWFSSFTPNIVATAWVGFDDHRRALGRSIAEMSLEPVLHSRSGLSI